MKKNRLEKILVVLVERSQLNRLVMKKMKMMRKIKNLIRILMELRNIKRKKQ
jgi:hypothetical protein